MKMSTKEKDTLSLVTAQYFFCSAAVKFANSASAQVEDLVTNQALQRTVILSFKVRDKTLTFHADHRINA